MVKNPPANAGDIGLPWSRKIPHAPEQLGPWATITGALKSLETMIYKERSHSNESPNNNEDPVQPKTNS